MKSEIFLARFGPTLAKDFLKKHLRVPAEASDRFWGLQPVKDEKGLHLFWFKDARFHRRVYHPSDFCPARSSL